MIKYYCDVCGQEMEKASWEWEPNCQTVAEVCDICEMCPECQEKIAGMDVERIMLDAVRLAVFRAGAMDEAGQAEEKETLPVPAPQAEPAPEEQEPLPEDSQIRGRYSTEKRIVIDLMRDWRRANGLGSWGKLAKLAGVDEVTVRRMVELRSVPIAAWRRVGDALRKEAANADAPE